VWRVITGSSLEQDGSLLGGHDAAVGLAQRVGAIAEDALRSNIDFSGLFVIFDTDVKVALAIFIRGGECYS
jgi:hypothetical protein